MKPITIRLLGAGLSSAPSAEIGMMVGPTAASAHAPAALFKNRRRVIGLAIVYLAQAPIYPQWSSSASKLDLSPTAFKRLPCPPAYHARYVSSMPCPLSESDPFSVC